MYTRYIGNDDLHIITSCVLHEKKSSLSSSSSVRWWIDSTMTRRSHYILFYIFIFIFFWSCCEDWPWGIVSGDALIMADVRHTLIQFNDEEENQSLLFGWFSRSQISTVHCVCLSLSIHRQLIHSKEWNTKFYTLINWRVMTYFNFNQ
jgi:hypothetical protein